MIFNHGHDITCDHRRSHHHGTHVDDVMILILIILKYTHHRAKFFIRNGISFTLWITKTALHKSLSLDILKRRTTTLRHFRIRLSLLYHYENDDDFNDGRLHAFDRRRCATKEQR